MMDIQQGQQTAANMMWPAQHTWTTACDGLHPAGPCPGPGVARNIKVEITKLVVKPGDRVVARVNRDYLDEVEMRIVRERLRDALQLPPGTPIVVTTQEWTVTVESGQ